MGITLKEASEKLKGLRVEYFKLQEDITEDFQSDEIASAMPKIERLWILKRKIVMVEGLNVQGFEFDDLK